MTETLFGLDSVIRVPAWAHHAVGSKVALRYLSRYTPKAVTRAEYDYYRANGIELVTVFEDYADNALKGYDQGKSDAEWALRQAKDAGMELGRQCRWAVDFDTAGTPYRTDQYADAWAAVWGRSLCGPYGGIEVVRHQATRGFRSLWQTYAWSRGAFVGPISTLFQYSNDHVVGGVGVDFNHIYVPANGDFGQWAYRPSPPPDPYHVYLDGLRYHGRVINERQIAMAYDKAHRRRLDPRSHQQLATLRAQCFFACEHLWHVAHNDGARGPLHAAWGSYHRGLRFKGLWRRYKGHAVHEPIR